MKSYVFDQRKGNVEIRVNGELTYRWPLSSPERQFTMHLLSKLLSPAEQHRVLVLRMPVLALVKGNALDFYLPPAYRRLPPEPSLWGRLTSLLKKENHHARNQHPERTQ